MKDRKTILLIGGTGFIGRNVARRLIDSGNELVILTRKLKLDLSVGLKVHKENIVETNLNEIDRIASVVDSFNVSLVVHMASGIVPGSDKDECNNELLNVVLPTIRLLDVLSKKRIGVIFISSGGTIYGEHDTVINEQSSLNPLNHYAFYKRMIEQYILFLSKTEGLEYVIIRPSNVYGRYDEGHESQGFIEVAAKRMAREEPITVWGSGYQTRDFVHVSDLCSVIGKIVSFNITNELFNVAYGQSYSILKVIKILEDNLDIKSSIIFHNKRIVDVNHIKFDVGYLKSKISYSPLGIHDGIKLFIKNFHKYHKSKIL